MVHGHKSQFDNLRHGAEQLKLSKINLFRSFRKAQLDRKYILPIFQTYSLVITDYLNGFIII
jgi:hypothetical protein